MFWQIGSFGWKKQIVYGAHSDAHELGMPRQYDGGGAQRAYCTQGEHAWASGLEHPGKVGSKTQNWYGAHCSRHCSSVSPLVVLLATAQMPSLYAAEKATHAEKKRAVTRICSRQRSPNQHIYMARFPERFLSLRSRVCPCRSAGACGAPLLARRERCRIATDFSAAGGCPPHSLRTLPWRA